jgi:hypothetical protein
MIPLKIILWWGLETWGIMPWHGIEFLDVKKNNCPFFYFPTRGTSPTLGKDGHNMQMNAYVLGC